MKLKRKCTIGKICGYSCISKLLHCRQAQNELASAALTLAADALAKPSTKAMFSVLRGLADEDNAENITKAAKFVASYGIKSYFYEQGQPVLPEAPPPKANSNGYTSNNTDFVVVKAQQFSPEPLAIKQAIIYAIETGNEWSFSGAIESYSPGSRPVGTYLHELGHQVHYKGDYESSIIDKIGWKSLTEYGDTADTEYAAEHFIPWLIAPKEFKSADPIGYDYIDSLINKANEARKTGK
jgi:hypothetical protein